MGFTYKFLRPVLRFILLKVFCICPKTCSWVYIIFFGSVLDYRLVEEQSSWSRGADHTLIDLNQCPFALCDLENVWHQLLHDKERQLSRWPHNHRWRRLVSEGEVECVVGHFLD